MAIVFARSNLAQFRTLHGWLRSTGKAESFLLCSEANHRKWSGQIPGLVPFRPHGGKLKADGSFYYLTRVDELSGSRWEFGGRSRNCRRRLGLTCLSGMSRLAAHRCCLMMRNSTFPSSAVRGSLRSGLTAGIPGIRLRRSSSFAIAVSKCCPVTRCGTAIMPSCRASMRRCS